MTFACTLGRAFAIVPFFVALTACSSSSSPTGNGSSGSTDGTTGSDGGATSSDGGDGGATSSDGSTSVTAQCCLNGQFFACPDKAAFDKCGGGGATIGECMAKCMGNPTCLQGCQTSGGGAPDPSACTRTASRDSECTPKCEGVQHTTTNKSCTSNTGCTASEHCYGGKCYLSSAGAPCSSTADCGNVAQCNSSCCEL